MPNKNYYCPVIRQRVTPVGKLDSESSLTILCGSFLEPNCGLNNSRCKVYGRALKTARYELRKAKCTEPKKTSSQKMSEFLASGCEYI